LIAKSAIFGAIFSAICGSGGVLYRNLLRNSFPCPVKSTCGSYNDNSQSTSRFSFLRDILGSFFVSFRHSKLFDLSSEPKVVSESLQLHGRSLNQVQDDVFLFRF